VRGRAAYRIRSDDLRRLGLVLHGWQVTPELSLPLRIAPGASHAVPLRLSAAAPETAHGHVEIECDDPARARVRVPVTVREPRLGASSSPDLSRRCL
jgi:hypothetical protein